MIISQVMVNFITIGNPKLPEFFSLQGFNSEAIQCTVLKLNVGERQSGPYASTSLPKSVPVTTFDVYLTWNGPDTGPAMPKQM